MFSMTGILHRQPARKKNTFRADDSLTHAHLWSLEIQMAPRILATWAYFQPSW